MSKYAFGVDVGGTTVKLGLFNDEGQVLDKWEIPTVKDNGVRFSSFIFSITRVKLTLAILISIPFCENPPPAFFLEGSPPHYRAVTFEVTILLMIVPQAVASVKRKRLQSPALCAHSFREFPSGLPPLPAGSPLRT